MSLKNRIKQLEAKVKALRDEYMAYMCRWMTDEELEWLAEDHEPLTLRDQQRMADILKAAGERAKADPLRSAEHEQIGESSLETRSASDDRDGAPPSRRDNV